MAFSEEDAERDVADVRREWALLDSVGGFNCPEEVFAWAMNSHEGAVWGSIGEEAKDLLLVER